jgi:hypothetical protein
MYNKVMKDNNNSLLDNEKEDVYSMGMILL